MPSRRWIAAIGIVLSFFRGAAAAGDVPVFGDAATGAAGRECLLEGGLERMDASAGKAWFGWMAGYAVVPGGGRDGSQGVCCRNRAMDEQRGIAQTLVLNQTEAIPLRASAWSRAEGVDGTPNGGYSLYADIAYADGDHLWAQYSAFSVGSHDWERRTLLVVPAKPIQTMTVYGLFRGHTGEVWFDDFSLVALDAKGTLFENAFVSGLHPGRVSGKVERIAATGNGIACNVDTQSGGLAALEACGRVLGEQGPSLFVRDVAAESPFLSPETWTAQRDGEVLTLRGEIVSLGLRLECAYSARGTHLEMAGKVVDLSGKDRAVTVYVPVPIRSGAWQWHENAHRSFPATGYHLNTFATGVGALGTISAYPFAAISSADGGVAVGVPLEAPRHRRLGFHAPFGLLYAAFDLGLVPETAHFPSAATFTAIVFPFSPAWGFRAALEAYYGIYPASFEKRVDREGLWMAFKDVSAIPGFEDFGIAFQEGAPNPAWDEAHGILSFPYTEPMTIWTKLPSETPRTPAGALAYLDTLAQDPNAPQRADAVAAKASHILDALGAPVLSVVNAPWCDGAVFALNADPAVPAPPGAQNRGRREIERLLQAVTPDANGAAADGMYIDSYEFWANSLDCDRRHFEAVETPLVFDMQTKRPGILTVYATCAFERAMAERMHALGKLMMANGVLLTYDCCAPFLDVLGTETNWFPEKLWRPMSIAELDYRRALSGQKPYCFLMNTHYAAFSLDLTERYMARSLAFGMFPGFFSENAATACYFDRPECFEPARPLFKKYVPLIQRIAKAGWMPVTYAKAGDARVLLERFGRPERGEVFFTVFNPETDAVESEIAVDVAALGWEGRDVAVRELVRGEALTVREEAGNVTAPVRLEGEHVALLACMHGKATGK